MRMPHPFARRRPDRPGVDSPVESALRHSLAANAMDSPPADDLTERILAAVDDSADPVAVPARDRSAERPSRRVSSAHTSRTWGLPLVAAALVAAIVGIGIAVDAYHPGGHGHGHSQQAATDGPSVSQAVQSPTTPAPSTTPTTQQRLGTSGLRNVTVVDLTFYGTNTGVALASAHCLSGSGRCTALLKTSDGRSWTATGKTPFDVAGISAGCPASKCVDHIRFANDHDGYVYGPDAFFTTTDGGSSWTQRSGGAVALESLGGNVIRVRTTTPAGSCPPGCTYEVQRTSGVATNDWSTVTLPGGSPTGDGVQLSRGGTHNQFAYLLVTQNPAGGATPATSTLYASYDGGRSWTTLGEPCPQPGSGGGEVDSYQVSAGTGDDVTVLCRARVSGPYRVAVSTDAGKNFTLRSGTLAAADVASTTLTDGGGALPTVLAGDPATALAVAGRDVAVSTDGGRSWHRSADLTGSFASVGFESTTHARAISSDGSAIWTTKNAGTTWRRASP